MKILMVSIASLHFYRWTEHLRDAGHEIYWFDIRDSKEKSDRMDWLHHIIGWRVKFNYPGRYYLKKNQPVLYRFIQKFNDNDVSGAFEKKLLEIKPDLVHSFAMQLSCLPILDVMLKYKHIKWAYSSWGSDVFYAKGLQMDEDSVKRCFRRIDYLITDCKRDYQIALSKGFISRFAGVFPGNGGVDFLPVADRQKRKLIMIKGYNQGVGRGLNILKALSLIPFEIVNDFKFMVYGADLDLLNFVTTDDALQKLEIEFHLMKQPVPNHDLIEMMGKSYLHIGNGISDGIPNSMIEAMGMGAIPIQSNPGGATAEVITHGKNGLLIYDPENIQEISELIKDSILNRSYFEQVSAANIANIRARYGRDILRQKIAAIYEGIL